jgi:hypothetical protein
MDTILQNNRLLNRFILVLVALAWGFMLTHRFYGESGTAYKEIVSGDQRIFHLSTSCFHLSGSEFFFFRAAS